ncbi:MAG: hypothetical protein E4H18_00975 [Hyphomicrobiales bacterium]|nr:MAG: hypothetical protein E4H18_00975 [Hyphomicrobiales bacterium]
MKRRAVLLMLLLVGLTSCDHNVYQIRLVPKDDGFSRELTAWRTSGGEEGIGTLPEEELKEIVKHYPAAKPDSRAVKHNFAGTFTDKTPADVGGAGWLLHHTCRMGTAWRYVERFRGNPDVAGTLARATQAIDRISDMLIGWLGQEFGGHKDLAKLSKFIDTELRADLKNVAVYAWLSNNTSGQTWLAKEDRGEQLEKEMHARILHFVAERGYLRAEDVPLLARTAGMLSDDEAMDQAIRSIVKLFFAKAGLPESELIGGLASLFAKPEAAKASVERYLATTAEYKALLAEWRKAPPDGPETRPAEPDPMDVLAELGKGLIEIEFGDTTDELHLSLAAAEAPFDTNGLWDPKAHEVRWDGRLTARQKLTAKLPAICYAYWSKPATAFQQKHFGKILLEGKPLADYCLWRSGLSAEEGAEWDAFIDRLQPGKGLRGALESFGVTTTRPAAGGKRRPYLHEGVEKLLGALKDEQGDTAEPPSD